MRICLVYDCLYPHTVGGAERWYRNLAERLTAEGHEVIYLTLRQWPRGASAGVPGVEVVTAGPRMALYTRSGRRRIGPPLVFGLGVLAHLARHGGRYDVVHTASFPYFSLLAAAVARWIHPFNLLVDWHEIWSRTYWREYLGGVGGRFGEAVQALCLRIPQHAFCFAHMTARRLRAEGLRGEVTVLEGEYDGDVREATAHPASSTVVFAGRHIPEKRVPALVPAIALARERVPALRGVIFGDGPERGRVLDVIARLDLGDAVHAPGFVSTEQVEATLREALCMVLPSSREGYGLIVVEAASMGVPSVVVRAEDNAAVDLIAEGENGFVAATTSPQDLADAIVEIHERGEALREATARWFTRNAERLSLQSSLTTVAAAYASSSARR